MLLKGYIELSGVLSSHCIQQAKILLQLATPGVGFGKEVTTLVFWQCSTRLGCLAKISWLEAVGGASHAFQTKGAGN